MKSNQRQTIEQIDELLHFLQRCLQHNVSFQESFINLHDKTSLPYFRLQTLYSQFTENNAVEACFSKKQANQSSVKYDQSSWPLLRRMYVRMIEHLLFKISKQMLAKKKLVKFNPHLSDCISSVQIIIRRLYELRTTRMMAKVIAGIFIENQALIDSILKGLVQKGFLFSTSEFYSINGIDTKHQNNYQSKLRSSNKNAKQQIEVKKYETNANNTIQSKFYGLISEMNNIFGSPKKEPQRQKVADSRKWTGNRQSCLNNVALLHKFNNQKQLLSAQNNHLKEDNDTKSAKGEEQEQIVSHEQKWIKDNSCPLLESSILQTMLKDFTLVIRKSSCESVVAQNIAKLVYRISIPVLSGSPRDLLHTSIRKRQRKSSIPHLLKICEVREAKDQMDNIRNQHNLKESVRCLISRNKTQGSQSNLNQTKYRISPSNCRFNSMQQQQTPSFQGYKYMLGIKKQVTNRNKLLRVQLMHRTRTTMDQSEIEMPKRIDIAKLHESIQSTSQLPSFQSFSSQISNPPI